MRKWIAGAAVVTAVLAVAGVRALPDAHASNDTETNGTLVSTQSGKCLDDPPFSTTAGTQLDIWRCNGGSSQQWTPPATATSPEPVGVPGTWTLSFDDEFSGTSVDTSKWAIGDGDTVNDVSTIPANVSEGGGYLTLTLSNSSTGAVVCGGGDDTPCSGYAPDGGTLPAGGYAEARIWFPGSGTTIDNWPAWWASGPDWPTAGEVDIAEGLGTLTVNYHSPSGAHNQGTVPGTWSNGWHTYGVYRHATSDDVYWDGTLVKSFPTDDNGQPESLIINVGGGNTAVYGTASQVKVDYVRVWTGGS